jgi:hypothetical protein
LKKPCAPRHRETAICPWAAGSDAAGPSGELSETPAKLKHRVIGAWLEVLPEQIL